MINCPCHGQCAHSSFLIDVSLIGCWICEMSEPSDEPFVCKVSAVVCSDHVLMESVCVKRSVPRELVRIVDGIPAHKVRAIFACKCCSCLKASHALVGPTSAPWVASLSTRACPK